MAVVVRAGGNPRVGVVPHAVYVDALGVRLRVSGFEVPLAGHLKGPFAHFFQDAVAGRAVQRQRPQHRRDAALVHVAVPGSTKKSERTWRKQKTGGGGDERWR